MSYEHKWEVRYLECVNDFNGEIVCNSHWKLDTTIVDNQFCLMTQNSATPIGGVECLTMSKNEALNKVLEILGAEQIAFIESEGERQIDELVIPVEPV